MEQIVLEMEIKILLKIFFALLTSMMPKHTANVAIMELLGLILVFKMVLRVY